MRLLRVFRVNGDSLSCWFSPQGALSTAMLDVRGRERQVAGQLPGLNAENSITYLADLGYRREYTQVCLEVGRVLNQALQSHRLLVETVLESADWLSVSVVSLSERFVACPVRLFVGLYHRESDQIDFVAVHDVASTEIFQKCVTDPRVIRGLSV